MTEEERPEGPEEPEGPTAELEVSHEDLIALLGSLPERLADVVSVYDEERLRYRHGPAFPTVGELIGHLGASGAALEAFLTAFCLQAEEIPPLATVLEAPAAPLAAPLEGVLEDARRRRRRSADLLRGLPTEGWERRVDDLGRGDPTLEEAVNLVIRHELGHMAQLRNLASFFPQPSDLGPASPVA